ncbi:hypothetical protein [Pseudoalteromonas byunsanensis]|uniref:Uncharacterized protein n=1 Tax=Pseudoalteromonas byunsanensis TaxID=327939 RepID=A0A1S1N2D1_9GAMM|nr:hypothetical protein [Pseudoalteromonas byunsanensis]OHU93526.1 hypothetical protein BIW53_19445 [Pseudoalteromonas byunsanensis]
MKNYTTVYSPAMIDNFEIHYELIFTSVISVLLLSAVVFLYTKYKQSNAQEKGYHRVLLIGLPVILACYQLVTYQDRFKETKSTYLNYEKDANFNLISELEGRLIDVKLFHKQWPGHTADALGEDYLWKFAEVKTTNSSLIFNMEIDWDRSQKNDMPKCFTGDIITLFEKYIGSEVKIRYYNFMSNYHKTDKSTSTCLVDFKVKK